MIAWFRRLRRRRRARRPFPADWLPILERRVPFFHALQGAERERFLELLKLFIWEKHFIGAGGMEVDDEVRVVIAAPAVRLVSQLDLSYYDRLTEIVVYPDVYRHPDAQRAVHLGEAHSWGTVVLSWQSVLRGLENPDDGHDTATHEFAHVLDRATGSFDGTPELRARENYRPWAQIMSAHFRALRDGDSDECKVLDSYGAQNEAEFFAVATESFFEKPDQMKKRTPELYGVLQRFYGTDPAGE